MLQVDLMMGLREVEVFPVVKKMCQMRRLWDHSLSLVPLE